ncbi:MAG: metallophosphoesterase [Bacteroidetes Order II. Incertae sedis bacterium]|nr:metallophosphoesterase [Bacteroidetes Order II. bacterium]
MDRRSFLSRAGWVGCGLFTPPLIRAGMVDSQAFRVAYLTDSHLLPLSKAIRSFTQALHHLQTLSKPPDLIFNGGDAIMDALQLDRWMVKRQWASWKTVLSQENQLPIHHCLGNHDIWGWKLEKIKDRADDAQDKVFGKQWALDELGMTTRHYYFDQQNWRFVVLDSIHAKPDGYTARLDGAQFDWLQQTLVATPAERHLCIISHIPILSATVLFDGDNEQQGGWQIPDGWMHQDARRIKNLFSRHPNVRVCLSGHTHLVDDLTYNGVRYLCNGAVSGKWWRGAFQEFSPMYALLDFMPNGEVHRQMIPYLDA